MHSGGSVYCWGDNSNYMQFGEIVPGRFFIADPYPVTLSTFATFAQGSSSHMCGITAAGSAVCWGRDTFGEVGSGTSGTVASGPKVVAGGVTWADVSVGRISTCGVSASGVGYCWGSNFAGEIGTESVELGTRSLAPVPVDGGLTFATIVVGWRHACGITTGGSAYCWGENTRGQLGLGDPDSTFHRTPESVAGGERFVQLSLGGRHTCGITPDARALCWGENWAGQLGDGTAAPRSVPTQVAGGHRFHSIVTSSGFAEGTGIDATTQAQLAHTCALTEDGTPYCWGWNGVGQVGSGSAVQYQFAPELVSGGLRLDELGVGGGFTCGRRGDAVWCWGSNTRGQLGNGGIANSAIPVPVGAPFN
jgi:alpha-tubulin suppressor-like RCC1 family protein